MSTIEPEGPWAEAMTRAKATDPRNGRPSWNRLAELAGLSTSTVTAMVSGSRRTSATTVIKIADALNVPAEHVSAWLSQARPVRTRYVPPPEADQLTDRQRRALTDLIRSFVADDDVRAGEDREERSAPMTPAGESPAPDDTPEPEMAPDVLTFPRRRPPGTFAIPKDAVADSAPSWRREAEERMETP